MNNLVGNLTTSTINTIMIINFLIHQRYSHKFHFSKTLRSTRHHNIPILLITTARYQSSPLSFSPRLPAKKEQQPPATRLHLSGY